MRQLIFLFIFLLFFSCSKEPTEPTGLSYPIEVIIRVSSGSGAGILYFSGTYGNSSTSIDVDGFLLEYTNKDYSTTIENSKDEVFAQFRKEQVDGTLQLMILADVNGTGYYDFKKGATTTASYGSVYISWKPD